MQEETNAKLSQNQLEKYQLNLQLPFIIKPPIFRKSHRYQRDGHWNQKQRLKYSVFLTYFREILEDALQKKRIRIYEMMSDMIITRNPNQCRSHHQKMEKYRSTIPEIIASVAEKYQPTIYQEHSHKYMTLIKGLLDNKEKYKRNFDPNDHKHKSAKKQPSATLLKPQIDQQQKIGCQIEHQKSQPQEKRNMEQQMELQQEKKELKKTAEEYSQANQHIGQDEEGVPVMRVGDMKEQDENESDNRQERGEMMAQQSNQIFAIPIPVGFSLDSQTRYCYEQQLLALELKKQWHAQNADQFYNQWSNQINSMKYCDDNIKFFKQLLMPNQQPL